MRDKPAAQSVFDSALVLRFVLRLLWSGLCLRAGITEYRRACAGASRMLPRLTAGPSVSPGEDQRPSERDSAYREKEAPLGLRKVIDDPGADQSATRAAKRKTIGLGHWWKVNLVSEHRL